MVLHISPFVIGHSADLARVFILVHPCLNENMVKKPLSRAPAWVKDNAIRSDRPVRRKDSAVWRYNTSVRENKTSARSNDGFDIKSEIRLGLLTSGAKLCDSGARKTFAISEPPVTLWNTT